MEEYKC